MSKNQLKELYKAKQELTAMEDHYKSFCKEMGIDELQAAIKQARKDLNDACASCVEAGLVESGSIRIINRGKIVRKVNVERLSRMKDDYECLAEYITIPVGIVEKFFMDYPDKDMIMDSICDQVQYENYDIIDIMEG